LRLNPLVSRVKRRTPIRTFGFMRFDPGPGMGGHCLPIDPFYLGSKILMLGVSYKAGIGDIRESPALEVIDHLIELGGEVSYHDPFVPRLRGLNLGSAELAPALADADIAVIATAHPQFDYEEIVASAERVVDLRGVARHLEADNLVLL